MIIGSKPKKVIVIGAGVAGLSAASYLAKAGYNVTILEKNTTAGGRARQFVANGFTFDMGPSWYWMPDVFEKFYNDFNSTTSDFYELMRLNPSYKVVWKDGKGYDIPSEMDAIESFFEQFEPGSSHKLKKFLSEAAYKYHVGINDLVYKPSLNFLEFADLRLLKGLIKMDVLTNMRKHVNSFVKHPFLRELLEFPVLFLGALPENTPALYSLMNYADISLGTWYPMGGMHKIIEAFVKVAKKHGVEILLNQNVTQIKTENKKVKTVITNSGSFEADVVVAAADYNHIEQNVLEPKYRLYSQKYWENRKMAPSCLLYYIGINKRLPNLRHHNLFFDADFGRHAAEIYSNPKWPNDPLFYVSVPSITDSSVAPQGSENLFLLIPIAPGLENDTEEIRKKYFDLIIERLEKHINQPVKNNIVYYQSYSISNFIQDYNAFKGNAYGLANTLDQTAILKPKIKSKKLTNLYFAGQLTVPGPGVPPSIISGKVAANLVVKEMGV